MNVIKEGKWKKSQLIKQKIVKRILQKKIKRKENQ